MPDRVMSIILPVYNQADHIAEIIEEYQTALARVQNPREFILVVNASHDNSLDACQKLAADDSTIRVLNSAQGGWGRAVKLGLEAAQGDLLCYTNSARTTAPDLLLLLLYGIANPDSVIKANRKVRESWRRRFGSLLYNLECRAVFDLPYWDINGTPKVFPRSFDKLLTLSRNDDLIDLEFNVICRREDYPILEVPIFSSRRHGGKSTTSYTSALRMYWGAYEFSQSVKR